MILVVISYSGFNGTVDVYPKYEPESSSDKITNLGNMTLEGGTDLEVLVTIYAVKGGHVTVYFNSSTSEIE